MYGYIIESLILVNDLFEYHVNLGTTLQELAETQQSLPSTGGAASSSGGADIGAPPSTSLVPQTPSTESDNEWGAWTGDSQLPGVWAPTSP